MAALPAAGTREVSRVVCRDEAVLRPGVDRLCRVLGVNTTGLSRLAGGSRPVYTVDDVVLKLFPPVALAEWQVEAGVLAAAAGRLPAPTPRVRTAGEHDGWGYVLMSRLSGVRLDAVWKRIPPGERGHLADHLGETIAALHRVPPPPVAGLRPEDWPAFLAGRRAGFAGRHRRTDLPPAWADQLAGFLAEVALGSDPPVMLHTEIRRQHLLVVPAQGGKWRLSGLVDFDHAMCGAREYELAGAGIQVAQGDSRFLRRLLTAYGYTSDQLDRDLRRRLLAWAILHKYSNFTAWLQRLPEPATPTLASLADRWFATG